MLDSTYIEDIFLALSDCVLSNTISYQPQDYKPLMSFRTILKSGEQLTERQGKFVLILLGKYKKQLENNLSKEINVDVLTWKHSFRIIDYSKSLLIEENDAGHPCAFLKFPYTLKDSFDKEFNGRFPYDSVDKTREVPLLNINPVKLLDFCNKNNFTIDSTFLDYVEAVEEVWANEKNIIPHCVINNDTVELKNAFEKTQQYFLEHKKNNIDKDLFLARLLGYPLLEPNGSPLQTICSNTDDTHFWTPDTEVLSDILAKLDLDRVVIVLDRQSNVQDFIEELIDNLNKKCYNTNNIRVCFRGANNNIDGKEFNNWIKMKGLGGKIDTGKIFIFKHQVAKWAKKFDFAPQLMVSNSIYEFTSISTRNFLKSCHATITVSDTPPTTRKENNIVNL